MQIWLGYLLIVVGLIMILLGVLAWTGVIKLQRRGSTVCDFLVVQLEKAPWVVVVGLILIYVGCKVIGVPLP